MPRLLPFVDLKWIYVHSETPFWWGLRLNNQGARRQRHRSNRCLAPSSEYWPQNGRVPRNLSHPRLCGLGCVSWCCDYLQYRDNGGVLCSKALLTTFVANIIWRVCLWQPGSTFLMTIRTSPAFTYAYEQNIWKELLLARCCEVPT